MNFKDTFTLLTLLSEITYYSLLALEIQIAPGSKSVTICHD